MPRTARLIATGEKTVYHVMSRTALPGFPLNDVEKDYFVSLIKRKSKLFFTRCGKNRAGLPAIVY